MPDFVKEAVYRSVESCGAYPDIHCTRLRERIGAYYGIPGEQIIFGNGAAELIFLLALALKPRRALLTAPAFAEYEQALSACGCECEFADPDWLVMMLTPENDMRDFERISAAFADFSPRIPRQALTVPPQGEAVMSPREALLAARETVPVGEAAGRVMASAAVTCPPAVPIAVMGERITAEQAELMLKYGITSVEVVI